MVEGYLGVMKSLSNELKEGLLEVKYLPEKRALLILLDKGATLKAIEVLNKVSGGEVHLTTISGADLGEDYIELTYFLWLLPQKLRAIVKTKLPKDNLRIQSIVNVAPAAILYEREIHEMLGVVFEEHPKLERLFLPEDWPKDVYPLRRS